MRKVNFLFVFIVLSILNTQAQVYKTLNVTAGSLSSALTETDKSTITNLTITGSIDASDFKIMRDNMPNLAVLDISSVTISAYMGINGTSMWDYEYPGDDIPPYAFFNKTSLKSILLPFTLPSIEANSFYRCGFTSIYIPPSVKYIGVYAFQESELKSISFDPVSECDIQYGTFDLCWGLDSVYLGKNITAIDGYAFGFCTSLKTFVINWIDPTNLQIASDAFGNTEIANCNLYVPCGTSEIYDTALIWKDFKEISEIKVSSNLVYIGAIAGSSSKIKIESNKSWTTISDQTWLKVSPLTGTNNDSISFLAEANQTVYSRRAKVTITESSGCKKTITIVQWSAPKNLNVTSGQLSSLLSSYDRNYITNLTLTGTIDARDFKTLRDSMPVLAFLDLSNTKIGYYEGLNGLFSSYETYMADEIPMQAFMGSHLVSIKLPNTTRTINFLAFVNCKNLNTVFIPESIQIIQNSSFLECINLTRLYVFKSFPPFAQDGAFDISTKTNCKLYVPFGTKELYTTAYQWQEFENIIEMPGFTLSSKVIDFPAQDTTLPITITSDITWTASSDQAWLTVNPATGTGKQTVNFTAGMNPLEMIRSAMVTIASAGVESQIISISQAAKPKIRDVIPGHLAVILTPAELNEITYLTLLGTIDARDFKTLRDKMPALTKLDLSAVTITSYTGTEGTSNGGSVYYPSNTIPISAFYNPDTQVSKTDLITIVPPSSVNTIGEKAFFQCDGLNTITIPSTVTSIGAYAFAGCKGLTSVNIPSSVTSIANGTFQNCSRLIIVLIPQSVTSIGANAFAGCNSLTTFTIPSLVAFIGNRAFADCDKLSDIYIPPSATYIGTSAFLDCSELSSVTLPSLITEINDSTFYNCAKLNNVSIPSGVISIDTLAFWGCSSLTLLSIPPTVTSIEEFAFASSGITNITFPTSITSIGFGAFYGCSSLTSVEIPSSVTILAAATFMECTGLKSILMPSSITEIGYSAFHHCINLSNVNIPSSVIFIETDAFSRCTGLKSVIIPASISQIRSNAFAECTGLTTIYAYGNTPASCLVDAFSNVDKINCILYVPYGTTSLYAVADQWKDFINIVEMAPNVNLIELPSSIIKIYPNPTKSILAISTKNHDANIIEIYCITGNLVLKDNFKNLIDISRLSKGVYILKAFDKKGNILKTQKIVKE